MYDKLIILITMYSYKLATLIIMHNYKLITLIKMYCYKVCICPHCNAQLYISNFHYDTITC